MNPPQERPQGFNEGKLAKKGHFACSWGCKQYFSTRNLATEHYCEFRRRTFETLIEMNKLSNTKPPGKYLAEAAGHGEERASFSFEEIRKSFEDEKNLYVLAWLSRLSSEK